MGTVPNGTLTTHNPRGLRGHASRLAGMAISSDISAEFIHGIKRHPHATKELKAGLAACVAEL